MKSVFAVLVLLLVSVAAEAKCIRETYQVTGRVLDRGGKPVAGASVTVNWGGTTKWNRGAESIQSSPDGSFAIDVAFDRLSGESVSGDICKGRLSSITVAVSAKGYRERRAELPAGERKANVIVTLERHDG